MSLAVSYLYSKDRLLNILVKMMDLFSVTFQCILETASSTSVLKQAYVAYLYLGDSTLHICVEAMDLLRCSLLILVRVFHIPVKVAIF